MSAHHATLSPSAFPKMKECIHYVSNPVSGPAAQRGTLLHKQISDHLLNGSKIEDAGAAAALERAREYIPKIAGVEQRLALMDEDFAEVTFGTADIWGYHDSDLILVDFKSGSQDPRSYREQMAVYALMLMDREQKDSCISLVVGIDSGEDYSEAWSFEEAEQVVWSIIERVRAGTEAPRENDACTWCYIRENCPVWKKPAEQALALLPEESIVFTREWILASPENAARFLTAYKKLEAIVEKDLKVSEVVKAALEAGSPVPGWKLQARQGSLSLDTPAVRKAWAALTSDPIPEKVGKPSVSLVQAKEAA